MASSRKKVILVIVEGSSDRIALARLFEDVYGEDYRVRFKVIQGDITIRRSEDHEYSTPANIRLILTGVVMETLLEYGHEEKGGMSAKDICEIVHIIDTDGVFIDESKVIENESLPSGKLVYETSHIEAYSRRNVLFRNEKKSAVVRAMIKIGDVSKIPYRAYFMSCNLDHVLHNEMNLPNGRVKEDKARELRRRFLGNPSGFLEFISGSDFSLTGSYDDSWEFIQKGVRSLNRYTNLGIQFGVL